MDCATSYLRFGGADRRLWERPGSIIACGCGVLEDRGHVHISDVLVYTHKVTRARLPSPGAITHACSSESPSSYFGGTKLGEVRLTSRRQLARQVPRVLGTIALLLHPAASLLCGETSLASRGRGGWLNDSKPFGSVMEISAARLRRWVWHASSAPLVV